MPKFPQTFTKQPAASKPASSERPDSPRSRDLSSSYFRLFLVRDMKQIPRLGLWERWNRVPGVPDPQLFCLCPVLCMQMLDAVGFDGQNTAEPHSKSCRLVCSLELKSAAAYSPSSRCSPYLLSRFRA